MLEHELTPECWCHPTTIQVDSSVPVVSEDELAAWKANLEEGTWNLEPEEGLRLIAEIERLQYLFRMAW